MTQPILDVVTVVFNPLRWKSRGILYRAFEKHMLESGVRLTTVELQYGDRAFECSGNPDVNHIGLHAGTMVFNKENLTNIGISRLPHDWKYVAWIDADVTFRKPAWASETVHALQLYKVVQPWSDCYDLGPDDDHLDIHRSFCRLVQEGAPIVHGPNAKNGPYRFGHPGFAWAATRQALEFLGGLVETAALGAADHHMAHALIGKVADSIPGNLTQGYKTPLYQWQDRAVQHIGRNVGYVPGSIEHSWHGSKDRRKYVERWEILVRNRFDPSTDLKKNVWGVVELAGNKPELRRDIDLYFRQRSEDSNTL